MRTGKTSVFVVGIAVLALGASALPLSAQESEEFPGPIPEAPLSGYTRSDGTIVLSDESFCRFLLGTLWGDDPLTYVELIDRSKRQKKAKQAAFVPGSDEATVARCADAISAYREGAAGDDTLLPWSRRAPVVPAALAGLLPDDFVAAPLAQPDQIGPAARTSGQGDLVSAPFEVFAGPWLAEVDNVACEAWVGRLRDARDGQQVLELSDTREYVYGLESGHYFWDVVAPGCEWSVDLVPVVLGPEPAPPDLRVAVPRLHGEGWTARESEVTRAYLTATQVRSALLDAGLTVGECVEEGTRYVPPGRAWAQDPIAGTLVEPGSAVDVTMTSDCDIVRGERVSAE